MTFQWIDFKEFRQQLKLIKVLEHYKVPIQRKGEQHVGPCPLPKHGNDRKKSTFSAHLVRGIFKCFGCQAQGNVLDLLALMEGVDPKDGRAVRGIITKLGPALLQQAGTRMKTEPTPSVGTQTARFPDSHSELLINPPLDFELKGLVPEHPFLGELGLKPAVVAKFGLGVAQRGTFKGQLVIPLHDNEGRLVGYAGLFLDDNSTAVPSYRFPGKREHKGRIIEFYAKRILYNGNRLKEPVANLILVREIPAVWCLSEHGFDSAASTMGETLSIEQAVQVRAIVGRGGAVWVITAPDDQGEAFVLSVVRQISEDCFVRWIRLPVGKEIHEVPFEELKARLS